MTRRTAAALRAGAYQLDRTGRVSLTYSRGAYPWHVTVERPDPTGTTYLDTVRHDTFTDAQATYAREADMARRGADPCQEQGHVGLGSSGACTRCDYRPAVAR